MAIIMALSLAGCGLHSPEGDELLEVMAVDFDADHVFNGFDNCPFIYNPVQDDMDHDGAGNACDIYVDLGNN